MNEVPGAVPSSRQDDRATLFALALALLAVVLVRTAWISDTAYLTLRTAEHAVEGYGLRWNVAERTQVYDHPLWLALIYGGRRLTGETYFATLALSFGLSISALVMLLRQSTGVPGVLMATSGLLLSPALLTFSTSGLETPLLHLLAVGAGIAALRTSTARSTLLLGSLVGLGALTHWTMPVLAGPVFVAALWRASWPTRTWALLLSVAPVAGWILWSWSYYGTVGPIAWRADGFWWRERLDTGLMFLGESTRFDPVLAAGLAVGAAVGLASRGRAALLASGIVLVTACAVASGGSPMAGRHLTAPYLVALLLIVRHVASSSLATLAALTVVGVAAFVPDSLPLTGATFGTGARGSGRTHDARRAQFQATGLLLENRYRRAPAHPEAARARQMAAAGERTAVSATPGFFGAAAGSAVHVIDPKGHTDPLLSYLPPAVGESWRWGAERRIPDGYLAGSADALPHEKPLADLAARIAVVTRGPTDADGRGTARTALPRAAVDLVRQSSYGPAVVRYGELAGPPDRTIELREGGLLVELEGARIVSRLTAVLSQRMDYHVALLDDGTFVASVELGKTTWSDLPPGARAIALETPVQATAIWFRCRTGVPPCTLSELHVVDAAD